MSSVGFKEPEKAKASINFATPAASMEDDEDYDDDLGQRIEDFKFDNPEDVEELKKCIQDVMVEAERIAQERLDQKAVSHFTSHLLAIHKISILSHSLVLHLHTQTKNIFIG